jgi:hypothetical protein
MMACGGGGRRNWDGDSWEFGLGWIGERDGVLEEYDTHLLIATTWL